MPYINEYAHFKPLAEFVKDPIIIETLANMRRMNSSDINDHEWKRIESKVTPSQFVPKYVTSTDGTSTMGHFSFFDATILIFIKIHRHPSREPTLRCPIVHFCDVHLPIYTSPL